MPYRIRKNGQWMAQVTIDGRKQRHRCKTKKEALLWEEEQKTGSRFQPVEVSPICTMSLGEWANEYLTFARQRFSSTAYTEKCFAFREFFLSEAKPETPIASYGSKAALVHRQYQARKRSGSSANRQRKNLRAAWEGA